MLRLIKLELVRNKLRPYFRAAGITLLLMVGFIFMIATVAKTENDEQFRDYNNLLKMYQAMNFIIYSVFSVVMLSKFVIEDYVKEKALLLFSYPVSREKIFMAKIILVMGFVSGGFLADAVIPVTIFMISEHFIPILDGNIGSSIIVTHLFTCIIFAMSIFSVGIIALRIGFPSRSVSATIVSGVVISMLLGNLIIGPGLNVYVAIGVCILFIVGIILINSIKKIVNRMEI